MEGRFYAHDRFNNSAQRIAEGAGKRLAETARAQGARIRCTVAVTRYKELNLLERATYKFEAVFKIGDHYKIAPLGEFTLVQDLSQEQRTALVRGTPLSSGGSGVMEYRLDVKLGGKLESKVVKIDPDKLVKIPHGDVFASLESKLADFIEGLRTVTPAAKTSRGREIQKLEREAIVKADKESKARTTAEPPPQAASSGKKTSNAQQQRPTKLADAETRARGLEKPMTESKGTGTEQPKQEIRAAELPVGRVSEAPGGGGKQSNSHVQIALDPTGSIMGRNVGRQAAGEGAGVWLLSKQHENLNERAKWEADNAVSSLKPQITYSRGQGNSVVVFVTFAVPKYKDLTGMSTDSFPIFWSANFESVPPMNPHGEPLSKEQLIAAAYNSPDTLRPRKEYERSGGEVPEGRVLEEHVYAVYPPLPANKMEPLTPRSGSAYWPWDFEQKEKEKEKALRKRLGMDSCKIGEY